MKDFVLKSIENRIGTILLNRPEKRNAISPELVQGMLGILDEFERDEQVKIVRIRAEGKAFCAGADLGYLQKLQQFSEAENLADSQKLKGLFQRLYEFPKVIIAEIQGHALAGGCGLVTVCDFAFSVPEALFGYTEVRIGFIPALVSVFLQEQIGASRAQELLLSGELISASKAAEVGLITSVVPSEFLEKSVLDFAHKLISQNSGNSMTETKALLRSFHAKERKIALDYAAKVNAKARAHEDCKRGIATFLNKETINW